MSQRATWRVRLLAFVSRYITHPGPHRVLYRATGGRIGGAFPGIRPAVLLLSATGRSSGKRRTTPLMYFELDHKIVVAATNNGGSSDPAWIPNIRANPRVEIQLGRTRLQATAREAEGEERQRLWAAMKERHPLFGLYEERTERSIPVVVLEPDEDEPDPRSST